MKPAVAARSRATSAGSACSTRRAAACAAAGSTAARSSRSSVSATARSGPANRQPMTSGSSRFQSARGRTRSPTRGEAVSRPSAATTRTASRTMLRDAAVRTVSSSTETVEPTGRSPPTTAAPIPCSARVYAGLRVTARWGGGRPTR